MKEIPLPAMSDAVMVVGGIVLRGAYFPVVLFGYL
jgi:hypothetical protein